MNKTISYKESTAIAIQAMISAARKDEYADRKRKSGFPQNRKKRDVTLKMYVNGTREEIIKRMQELPSMQ